MFLVMCVWLEDVKALQAASAKSSSEKKPDGENNTAVEAAWISLLGALFGRPADVRSHWESKTNLTAPPKPCVSLIGRAASETWFDLSRCFSSCVFDLRSSTLRRQQAGPVTRRRTTRTTLRSRTYSSPFLAARPMLGIIGIPKRNWRRLRKHLFRWSTEQHPRYDLILVDVSSCHVCLIGGRQQRFAGSRLARAAMRRKRTSSPRVAPLQIDKEDVKPKDAAWNSLFGALFGRPADAQNHKNSYRNSTALPKPCFLGRQSSIRDNLLFCTNVQGLTTIAASRPWSCTSLPSASICVVGHNVAATASICVVGRNVAATDH